MKVKYILFVLSLFSILSVSSQSFVRKYDLDFAGLEMGGAKKNIYGWRWVKSEIHGKWYLDSLNTSETKNRPLCIIKSDYNFGEDHSIRFHCSKTIDIPPLNQSIATVSVRSKSKKEGSLFLRVNTLDKNEDYIYTDSLSLDSRNWTTHKMQFSLKSARFILLEFGYNRGPEDSEQHIWISDLEIRINDELITDLEQLDRLASKKVRAAHLKEKHIMPLFTADKDINPQILKNKDIGKAKIIGLGDFSGGTSECDQVFHQLSKDLIKNISCKLLLKDVRATCLLLTDLYVQGIISDKYKDIIERTFIAHKRDYKADMEFVSWLREYNKDQEIKTHFLGVGKMGHSRHFFYDMMTYFLALFEYEEYNDYLKYAEQENEKALYELALNDRQLKARIGDENHAILMFYMRCNQGITEEDRKEETEEKQVLTHIKELSKIVLSKDEKALVFAHSRHLENSGEKQLDGNMKYTAGYYLKKEFEDSYYTISIQAGEGHVLRGYNSYNTSLLKEVLLSPPINSFEYAALQTTKSDCFFYPSKHLNESVYQLQMIYAYNEYISASLPKRFDAYIFSRQSTPHKNAETNLGYTNYFRSKEVQVQELVYQKHKEKYTRGEE